MSLVKKEVEVAGSTDAVVQGLVQFILASKQALADGWQVGSDLPVIVTAAVSDLIPALGELSKLGEEFKDDKAAVIKAVVLGASDLVELFQKK